MDPAVRGRLSEAAAAGPPAAHARQAVLAELNRLLAWPGLYDQAAWAAATLTERQQDLLKELGEKRLAGQRLVELNRSLLAAALGESIAPGPTVLAELETAELRLQLSSAQAELAGYLKQKDAAMAAAAESEEKRAEAQMAQAQADRTAAHIRLLEHRIAQATVVSAIDGVVNCKELKRQQRAPVEAGTELFHVVSLAELWAELSVPEDMIADVQQARRRAVSERRELGGELATAARPGRKIAFLVDRIDPVAQVIERQNVFKVRARLLERPEPLNPGAEGLAKVDIGRESYAYIWTRRMLNWVRMQLWW